MLDRRCVRRRHKAWIDVAEAAIAGDHMRCAFLGSAEFAIPHHVAGAEILHRAPRRIAEAAGVARGHTNCCRKSDRRQCRSEADCHGAKIVMPSSLSWRQVQAAAVSMQDEAAIRGGRDLPDVVRGKEKHENDGGSQ